MGPVEKDLLRAAIILVGGFASMIFIYLGLRILGAKSHIYRRNRRAVQLAKKYKDHYLTTEEQEEVDILISQGILFRTYVRDGERARHALVLTEEALEGILGK